MAFFDHLLGLWQPDVLADKVITSGKDDVSTAGVSHLGKNGAHTPATISGLSKFQAHQNRAKTAQQSELRRNYRNARA
jgi:hypothetical protein